MSHSRSSAVMCVDGFARPRGPVPDVLFGISVDLRVRTVARMSANVIVLFSCGLIQLDASTIDDHLQPAAATATPAIGRHEDRNGYHREA